MQHRNLLITLLILLIASAGGVFFLVNKESNNSIGNEASFVAGVGIVDDIKILEEDLIVEVEQEAEKIQNEKPSLSASQQTVVERKEAQVEIEPVVQDGMQEEQETQELPVEESEIAEDIVVEEDTPEINESEQEPPEQPAEPVQHQLININTAELEELQSITGVGPTIGQRIIDYRNVVGLFKMIEEIKNVQGVGDITYEKMKDQITVGDVPEDIIEEESPSAPTVPSEPVEPVSEEPFPIVEPEPEEEEQPVPEPPAPEVLAKININTADYEELQEITGVGPVIAQRIIDYRNENSLFLNIEELKNVKGIGDVSFEKMRDEITI